MARLSHVRMLLTAGAVILSLAPAFSPRSAPSKSAPKTALPRRRRPPSSATAVRGLVASDRPRVIPAGFLATGFFSPRSGATRSGLPMWAIRPS